MIDLKHIINDYADSIGGIFIIRKDHGLRRNPKLRLSRNCQYVYMWLEEMTLCVMDCRRPRDKDRTYPTKSFEIADPNCFDDVEKFLHIL